MTSGTAARALDGAALEKLVAAAAPSIHNTQPWRFRLDPATTTVEVHAAADRALYRIDPGGRGLHVSAGAAVFNLRAAVARFGWEPVVRLLPRPADPGCWQRYAWPAPEASGNGTKRPNCTKHSGAGTAAVSRSTGPPVPSGIRAEIAAAAAAEDAHLVFPGPQETARVLQLTSEAEWRGLADPARAAESRAWVRDGTSSGVPTAALSSRDSTGRMPVRDFTAGLGTTPRLPEAYEQRPAVAVLGTMNDGPADWLRAGQGLERALLVATAHGVRASLFSQAVEWPDLRWALRDPREEYVHVQMVMRFGYGPEGPATPRRPVTDVLGIGA
ncbi:Acg family FMN-binding oxidoreductase [Streptomyces sp. NPDC021224]|uniref:Acg family FMN-binding oxidoreductase n=1 Tax=unclassified Streptomyces TaxID=2593676 RepID=UPI0037BA93C9